jgi:hypothetical protein
VESVETGETNTVMSSVREFQTVDSRVVHNQRRRRHEKKKRSTHQNNSVGLPPLPPLGQEKKGILKSNGGKQFHDNSDPSAKNDKASVKKERRFLPADPPTLINRNHDFGGRLNSHTELPSERRKQAQMKVSRRVHSFDGVLDPEHGTFDRRKLQLSENSPPQDRKLSDTGIHQEKDRQHNTSHGEYRTTREEEADGSRNDDSAFAGREPHANSDFLYSSRLSSRASNNENPHTISSEEATKSSNVPRKEWSKSSASASISLYAFNSARYAKESRIQNQSSFDSDSELIVKQSPSYATENMGEKPKKVWRVWQRDTITRVASDLSSVADNSTGESIVSVDRKCRKSRARVRNPSKEPMSVC